MLLSTVAAALLAASAPSSTVKLALLDFEALGASPELTAAAQGVVAHELEQLGVFQVTTGDAVRALIALERQREIMGCGAENCPVQQLGAVNADYLVEGKVTGVAGASGKHFTLELTLLNVSKGQREASQVESGNDEAGLLNEASRGAVLLVQKLLAARSGSLIVSAAELGAVVKVDGVAMGTTPLNGRLTLPGGPHIILLEKDGFVAFTKQVRIEPDQVREEQVAMVPSPDFIEAHKSRAGKMRLGAYIASGVAAGALVTGIALQASADKTYGSTSTPNTFLYDRAQLSAGDESFRSSSVRLQGHISTEQSLSAVGFVVSAVAAAGAGFLWIAGDDPGRYDKFRVLNAALAPVPGGAAGSVAVAF